LKDRSADPLGPGPDIGKPKKSASESFSDPATLTAGLALIAAMYLAREILIPIVLALIFSFLVAPLVRILQRLRLNQGLAVLVSVVVPLCIVVLFTGVVGTQIAELAQSLPQYRETIDAKVKSVQNLANGELGQFLGRAGQVIARVSSGESASQSSVPSANAIVHGDGNGTAPPTQIITAAPESHGPPLELVGHFLSALLGPLGTAFIVFIVSIFMLLERNSVRDRFVKLIDARDSTRTTVALDETAARLSRYFVSQLGVNTTVGVVIGGGLALMGGPSPVLWGVLAALLRFIPYIGVWIAGLLACLLAAAVEPGWSMLMWTAGLFAVTEVIAGQIVEPLLYGHTTGLSPLSVVVAAIFWSWIWGPIGLLVSTPLTLCLVVAGHHIPGLRFLDVLLGDTPALSMSERFYQRAMSGDHEEIVTAARTYLKRKSFARYCDRILLPALHLAGDDLGKHSITPQQLGLVKSTIARVIEALGADACRPSRRSRRSSVLEDTSIGAHLRSQRESAIGKWQGPLAVPPGSLALCLGLGSTRDDLVTELLVRILRTQDIDARHLSLEDLAQAPPAEANPHSVSMLFVVSADPAEEWSRIEPVLPRLRARFPDAVFVGLLPEGDFAPAGAALDLVARTFEAAAAEAAARYAKVAA
jgi:predicted PurR-regulated permease PerM